MTEEFDLRTAAEKLAIMPVTVSNSDAQAALGRLYMENMALRQRIVDLIKLIPPKTEKDKVAELVRSLGPVKDSVKLSPVLDEGPREVAVA